MTTRENTPENGAQIANEIAGKKGGCMLLDERAKALLDALNELFVVEWKVEPRYEFERAWCRYELTVAVPGRQPLVFQRDIQPAHINGEPFRTALKFADEVCERMGRYVLLKPDDEE